MTIMRAIRYLTATLLSTGCASSQLPLAHDSMYDRVHISWVRIEGGSFVMGDTFYGNNEDALPVHRIRVASFSISRFETSFEQYDAYARHAHLPRPMPDDVYRQRRAVSDVSWKEALAFCTSLGARLPSEVEWEYAAAGGAAKQLYAGTSDSLSLTNYASYQGNSAGLALPVGSKKPNLFGLYDMSGNVAEWIDEYYQAYPEDGEEPVIADENLFDLRIIRGGSVWASRLRARTYWRAGTLKEVRTPSVGFRCAKN